jgi:hypothetical protein
MLSLFFEKETDHQILFHDSSVTVQCVLLYTLLYSRLYFINCFRGVLYIIKVCNILNVRWKISSQDIEMYTVEQEHFYYFTKHVYKKLRNFCHLLFMWKRCILYKEFHIVCVAIRGGHFF